MSGIVKGHSMADKGELFAFLSIGRQIDDQWMVHLRPQPISTMRSMLRNREQQPEPGCRGSMP